MTVKKLGYVLQTVALFLVLSSLWFSTYALNPYDLDGDGDVDIYDIAIVAAAFGTYDEHDLWNPDADVNGDGKVNIIDVVTVAMNFGT